MITQGMKTISAILLAFSSSLSIADAKKVVLHDIQQKSQLHARSFDPLSNMREVGSTRDNRNSFWAENRDNNVTAAPNDINVSEEEEEEEETVTETTTTSATGLAALSVGITDTTPSEDETNAETERKNQISPFLSTTLLTTLSPIPTSSLSSFNGVKQSAFSDAYIAFLEHVLEAQEVYDVKVLDVSIFDKELVSLDGTEVEERGGIRHLLTNGLQFSFEKEEDFDDYTDDDKADEDGDAAADATLRSEDNNKKAQDNKEWIYKSLRFGIVVSAEHTLEPSQETYMSNDQFQKIVLHISNKFHSHLLEFVKDADLYFRNVETVDVVSYTGDGGLGQIAGVAGTSTVGFFKQMENGVKHVEEGKLTAWSIVGIAVGGFVFIALMFATVKFYRREQILKANRWRSQEIANSNANASMVKSLRVLYGKQPVEDDISPREILDKDDDYSFEPFSSNATHDAPGAAKRRPSAKEEIQKLYRGYTDIPLNSINEEDEESHQWPKVVPQAPSPLFPGAPPASNSKAKLTVSHSLEDEITSENLLYNLPRQHCYAPPGKVGVAIDIQDGQPVVHKIKKGSPLEGLLQPQDIVVAVDDVDTNCMSAADVTHLMVKRMNYRRKITFVRRG